MKQEIKERWVEALRSGKYEQGTGTLTTGSGRYCCLGVLCDLAVADGAIEPPTLVEAGDDGDRLAYRNETEHLPRAVQLWAGLDQDSPEVHDPDEDYWKELVGLNDDVGLTFHEIADLIEAQDRDWEGHYGEGGYA